MPMATAVLVDFPVVAAVGRSNQASHGHVPPAQTGGRQFMFNPAGASRYIGRPELLRVPHFHEAPRS